MFLLYFVYDLIINKKIKCLSRTFGPHLAAQVPRQCSLAGGAESEDTTSRHVRRLIIISSIRRHDKRKVTASATQSV